MKIEADSLLIENIKNEIALKTTRAYNDFDETFWIHGKSGKQVGNVTYCYIGQKRDKIWIRFRLDYFEDDWVFMDKVDFFADGETYNIYVEDRKTKVMGGGNGIHEWFDILPSESFIDYLLNASKAEDFKYRLSGRENSYKRTVSRAEKLALNEIINSYLLFNRIDNIENGISKQKSKIIYQTY
jgi:hypothetical protein